MGSLLRACEFTLRLCASLTLAVCTISGIAALLAIATWYESYYGSAAAKVVVYESPLFYAVLFLLALNVAAVVISRYPWKKKHTGFIVTHIGIEILLFGCVLDIRGSEEGRVALRPGQSVDVIDSTRDGLFVSWASGGRMRTETVSMDCWREAGFPSLGRFLLSPVFGLSKPGWPEHQSTPHAVAPGVAVEVLDWAPAAKTQARIEPKPGENPAVELRLSGNTPAGASVDERVILHNADEAGASGTFFNGVIEATLRSTKSAEEAKHFLEPVDIAALPPSGELDFFVDGKWQSVDVSAQLGKTVPVGTSNLTATVEGYYPAAKWDGHAMTSDGEKPTDPMVKVTLSKGASPALPLEMVVSARFPALTGPLATPPTGFGPLPLIVYDHPAVLKTDPAGMRGRLQLLEAADGRLLYRRCGLHGIEASGELTKSTPMVAWMGLSLELTLHEREGTVVPSFIPADVAAKDLSDSMRAARVALIIDGERHEFSVARGGGAQTVATPRGEFTVHYGFEAVDLPASLTLKDARMSRDPGSERAASYESDVEVATRDGEKSDAKITMNEPLTVAGRTFYQAGFDETGGAGDDGTPASAGSGPISVLSMRYDPGRPVKYAGCLFIVGGIFLMFYMKSYFQKPAAAAREPVKSSVATMELPAGQGRLNLGREA